MNRLRGLPAAVRIDGKLLVVLVNIFTFHQQAPTQITIGRLYYLDQLGESLFHWLEAQAQEGVENIDNPDETEGLTDALIAQLMLHNLNAAGFLKYCMNRVDDYAAARLAHDLTSESLSFAHQQQIALGLPVRSDTAYDTGLAAINLQVAAAIETRIRFVEYLQAEDARIREHDKKGKRLFIAASAAQLALGIGGNLTAGLFPESTPGQVLRLASRSFSTAGAPEPSYTTFRNNAYKKTSGNVKKLNQHLDAIRAAVNTVN